MGCENCGSCGTTPSGCGNKGHCATGGCNKLNTFDWLSHIDLPEQANADIVEVGFKQNARKEFFRKPHYLHVHTGDYVVVESSAGSYDIGRVSVAGELVRLQMKKKRVRENAALPNILRVANERDLERLQEARGMEKETLVKARAIARSLNLDMKVGDVEYQGDKRKVTFYYTADGRIDFRELIRIYAKEFKVKIEMRQIGARQESARIGGIGACGRELCCSTWLGDFKSVSTVAARYQNLAINQSKLSGQCGRLKCCLNYELKAYLDALRDFPKGADRLETQRGTVILIKTDVFKRIMYYGYQQQYGVADIQALTTTQVRQLIAWNQQGIKPNDLAELAPDESGVIQTPTEQDPATINKNQRASRLHRKIDQTESVADDDAPIELPELEKSKRKKNKKRKPDGKPTGEKPANDKPATEKIIGEKPVNEKNTTEKPINNRPHPKGPNPERTNSERTNNNRTRPQNNNQPKNNRPQAKPNTDDNPNPNPEKSQNPNPEKQQNQNPNPNQRPPKKQNPNQQNQNPNNQNQQNPNQQNQNPNPKNNRPKPNNNNNNQNPNNINNRKPKTNHVKPNDTPPPPPPPSE